MKRLATTCHAWKRAFLFALLLVARSASAFDIVSQNIAVDVSGPTLHVEIDAVVEGEGEMPLYAFAAPATATLDGAPLSLAEDTGQYAGLVQWLTLPGGEAQAVHIVVDGPPTCRSQINPGLDACTYSNDERVLLPDEPGAAWYLTNLLVADAFVGAITVRAAPEHTFVVAGQGRGVPVDDGSGAALRFDVVVPTGLLAVVARAAGVVENGRVIGGLPNEEARAPMQRFVDTAAAALPRYEELYGALPVDQVRVAPLSGRFPFGGMGLFGTILIGDFIATPQYDYLVEQGAAHELAHSWWGGMGSAANPLEGGFLQESFAEYSAWRALGDIAGDVRVRDAGVRMNAVWYLTQMVPADDVAILDATTDSAATSAAYVLVTYHKGSVVLRTLEEQVGAEAFTSALAALVARGPAALSVAAFAEELAAVSDIDGDAQLDQWLRRPGHPQLVARVGDGRVDVEDRAGFAVRVPLRITSASGDAREMTVDAGGQGAALRPGEVLVEIDPHWTQVRTVRPAVPGDVSCDGRVDALDLIEVALRHGGAIPGARRQDGSYDPLYDIDDNGSIDSDDVDAVLAAAIRDP
jgi:hypothetical protein